MVTLKGQNFRILTYDATLGKYQCVGMATSCAVTLTGNTDDSSTKDDIGGAQKPEITSKAWSVQVESLSMADTAAILAAVKSQTAFTLLFDETSTTDNQTAQGVSFARQGKAYLNDATFNFNDRENASKSLQFTGSGELSKVSSIGETDILSAGSYTKGQFVRFFLGSDNSATPEKVIAAAKSLSLHVSLSLEDATTKDTTGDWQIQEPTGLSYDLSISALMRSGESITSSIDAQSVSDLEEIYENSTPVKWEIANVSGTNNRTKGTVIVSGSVIVTQLKLNGGNRQNATYEAQLTGYGEYSV